MFKESEIPSSFQTYVYQTTGKGGKRERSKGRCLTKSDVQPKEVLPVSVKPMI